MTEINKYRTFFAVWVAKGIVTRFSAIVLLISAREFLAPRVSTLSSSSSQKQVVCIKASTTGR